MRKNSAILIAILFFFVVYALPCAASINITKLNDLVEQSISLDNTEVTVQGEVIGEALERGECVWININDTTNAIGIWLKKSDIEQIHCYGDYRHKGDIVQITGIFCRACPEHGGDVDIHCTDMKVIEIGHIVKEQISTSRIIIAIMLLIITAIVVSIYYKHQRMAAQA